MKERNPLKLILAFWNGKFSSKDAYKTAVNGYATPAGTGDSNGGAYSGYPDPAYGGFPGAYAGFPGSGSYAGFPGAYAGFPGSGQPQNNAPAAPTDEGNVSSIPTPPSPPVPIEPVDQTPYPVTSPVDGAETDAPETDGNAGSPQLDNYAGFPTPNEYSGFPAQPGYAGFPDSPNPTTGLPGDGAYPPLPKPPVLSYGGFPGDGAYALPYPAPAGLENSSSTIEEISPPPKPPTLESVRDGTWQGSTDGSYPQKGGADAVGDPNAPLDGELYPQEGIGKDYFVGKGADVSESQLGVITPTQMGALDAPETDGYAGFPTGSDYGSYSGMPENSDGAADGGAVVSDFTHSKDDDTSGWASAEPEKPQDYSNGVVAVDSNKNTNPLQIKETD